LSGERLPIAVLALVGLELAVYAFTSSRSPAGEAGIIDRWALVPYDLTQGVVLAPPAPTRLSTLVSAQFLHASALHVASNMLALLVAGPGIEFSLDALRFVALFLTCGLAGWAAQIAADPGSHVPVVGASGAIAGVLGAYALRFPLHEVATLPAAFAIGLWVLVQAAGIVAPSAAGGGVAYFAHLGGFVAGVLLVGPFTARTRG